eukprot:g3179.t1
MEEHIKRPLRARFNLWSRGFELVLVEPLDGSRHVAWTQRNWEWCFIWWIGNMEARLDALMRRELRRLAAVLNPATNPKDSTAASRERKPGDLVPAADLRDTMEACCDLWGLSRYMELRQMKLVPQKGDELEQVLRGLLSVVGRLCYDSRPSGGNAAALGLGTLWALLRAPLAVQLATDGVRALPEVCDALALVERKQKWLATAKRAALVNGGGVLACLTSCSERSREELAQSKERRALLESLSALAIPEINYAIFNVGYDHHHTTKLIQFLENLLGAREDIVVRASDSFNMLIRNAKNVDPAVSYCSLGALAMAIHGVRPIIVKFNVSHVTLALQTALPATDLKEYVALALWGLARNQRNRRRLGTDVGALRGLLVLLPPMNVSDRLCEYLCVALWMLCCDEVNAATFAQAGGLHVFCQHLRYPKGAFHRCKLLSVGILRACYYYNRDVTSPILLNRELGPLLVDIVKDEKAPDKLHVLTLQFMEEMMGEETHRKALIAYDGPHPVDRLLIYVLKGRSTLKHRFALEAIARRAQSRMRGRIIGALGAIGRIAQLGIGAEGCVCGGVCAKDFMEGGAQFTRDRAIKELIRRSKGSYVEVTLAKFPHHPGCRQCEGLYEHFDLPDGTSVHFYCNEKQASEVPVPAAGPPKDPVELADAHMTGLPPLPKLLEPTEGTPPILPSYFFPESPPITVHIGPDGAFVNDKQRVPPPDPVQSPWTAHHQEPWPTVRWYVEHCMRGLPGSRMHWLCDTLLGPGDTSVGDSDDGAPPPTPCGGRPRYPVPKQDLKIGLFRNRRRECESHAFLDKPSIIAAALENDLRMFGDGNGLKRVERDAGVRERVAEVLRAHYAEIRNIFKYYCTPGAGHVFSITLNPFSDMARECNLISEADHDSLSMADLDTIFIEATYQHDQRSPRNLANSICRFEFVEAMVRIAKRKYCYHRNGSAEKKMKLDEALFALLDLHILPLAKRVRDGNDFREKIVYFQDVLSVLQKYLVHLKSVFDRFATVFRPRLGKVLQWADWSELMIMALAQTRSEGGEIGYIGGLTEREIKTAFTCSKMAFINEIENDVPEVMSFVDFLEGFVRLGWGMIIAPEVIAADRTALTGHFCEDPHCSCHTEGEGEPFERYFIVERLERLAPKFVALSRNR